jgi:hypothetical protein
VQHTRYTAAGQIKVHASVPVEAHGHDKTSVHCFDAGSCAGTITLDGVILLTVTTSCGVCPLAPQDPGGGGSPVIGCVVLFLVVVVGVRLKPTFPNSSNLCSSEWVNVKLVRFAFFGHLEWVGVSSWQNRSSGAWLMFRSGSQLNQVPG